MEDKNTVRLVERHPWVEIGSFSRDGVSVTLSCVERLRMAVAETRMKVDVWVRCAIAVVVGEVLETQMSL
jgi:hypothetical protein